MRKLHVILALLVVAAIVLVLPSFLAARQRGKQKTTMAALRSIGTAIEIYKEVHGVYPSPEEQTIRSLATHLEPDYIVDLRERDGWYRLIAVTITSDSYELRSYGRDGVEDTFPAAGAIAEFTADLVFSNGQFQQWPEGT